MRNKGVHFLVKRILVLSVGHISQHKTLCVDT